MNFITADLKSVKVYGSDALKIKAHYVYAGKTPCGLDLSKQQDWPTGHLWTTRWKNVTCVACLGH